MNTLIAIAIPVVILLMIRALSHWLFPWLMRPLERTFVWGLRTGWGIVWTKPAQRWGGLNVAWMWLLVGTVAVTIDGLISGRADPVCVACLWMVVGGMWWCLRVWNRWRLRPYRLPRRHRGED